MRPEPPSLASAFHEKRSFDRLFSRCPHCGASVVLLQMAPGPDIQGKAQIDGAPLVAIRLGYCPGCLGPMLGAVTARENVNQGRILWPLQTWPDKAPEELEPDIRRAYDEARAIIYLSSMGSAVLARRALQHVIRLKLGITKRTLFDEIEEAAKREELTKPTRDALHHVREIGNWGAHPIESDQAGQIVEVTQDEACYTLEVLELLFRDLYELPKQTGRMADRIKSKM